MTEETENRAAIITGASSGIGNAIAKQLIARGYHVYGIGRRTVCAFTADGFSYFSCDLMKPDERDQLMDRIDDLMKKKEEKLSVLINNAGAAYYGLHEELRAEEIHEMVCVDLELPMLLSQRYLRQLKRNKGTVINISSVTARQDNPHGVCYGAVKAGLLSFGRSLFYENRKYGVRVMTIMPDMTETGLYRNASFSAESDPFAALTPEDTAEAVCWCLERRQGINVTELMLQPQMHRLKKKDTKI